MLHTSAVWWALAMPLALRPVIAFPPSNALYNPLLASSYGISARQDEEIDFDDLSFITKMAAIGDSYSAGIGAGDRLGSILNPLPGSDWRCSRYDHSYPNLLHTDGRLGDPSNRQFEFKSCSGAVIDDVMKKQIPELSGGQQVILVSAGGNDAGFPDILNQCIYQWLAFTKAQSVIGKIETLKENLGKGNTRISKIAAGIDWDKFSTGCSAQLQLTEDFVNSKEFEERLKFLILAAKTKLAPDGVIYYTGYGQFFNDHTSACDKVTWSTWVRKLYNTFQEDEYLTKDKRKTFNNLVDAVNQKIREAVDNAGDNVVFIDFDPYVEKLKGRYCEDGVDEAHKESDKRAALMFYKLDTLDIFGSNPWKRGETSSANGTFEGDVNLLSYISKIADPDASLREEPFIDDNNPDELVTVIASHNETIINAEDEGSVIENIMPDGYTRVFHPQIILHQLIANLIIYHMTDKKITQLGYDSIPEVSIPVRTTCPIDIPCEDDSDCSSTTCTAPGLEALCKPTLKMEGMMPRLKYYCKCASKSAPSSTSEPPAPEPTETEKPQLTYPDRLSWDYSVVAWNSDKWDCSTQPDDPSELWQLYGSWPLTEEYFDAPQTCWSLVNGWHYYNCFMANMNRDDIYICGYAEEGCTGDYVEMRRDDIKELKPGYLLDKDGHPTKILNYALNKNGC